MPDDGLCFTREFGDEVAGMQTVELHQLDQATESDFAFATFNERLMMGFVCARSYQATFDLVSAIARSAI
ncbi:hypothetical protein [Rhodococcus triatomae]|nr:hypothetical protein G419_18175 [Rhodococcus triatomae BKS 15-14]